MSGAEAGGVGLARPVLDPLDRASEFLFGLIMALTFTCTLSVATAEEDAVLTVAVGALACNVAWGIVDAVMYLLSCLAQGIAKLTPRGGSSPLPDCRQTATVRSQDVKALRRSVR